MINDKEFWEFVVKNGSVAVLSRLKARDESNALNEQLKQDYIKELKEKR